MGLPPHLHFASIIRLFILLSLLPMVFLLSAQPQTFYLEEWHASDGSQDETPDRVVSAYDFSGHTYVAGSTLNQYGRKDLLLAKYNSSGGEVWSEVFNLTDTTANVIVGNIILSHCNGGGVKYYIVCQPGADPDDIALVFSGHESLSTDGAGNLVIGTSLEDIILPRPEAFQVDGSGNESSVAWTPGYSVEGDTVRISNGTFDTGKYLVLRVKNISDTPLSSSNNIEWCTYYGGQDNGIYGYETIRDLSFDSKGDFFYITGETRNADFPLGNNIIDGTLDGGYDAYVIKFDNAGIIRWGTFYGGKLRINDEMNAHEYSFAAKADNIGNVYFAGYTESVDLPLLVPGPTAYLDTAIGNGSEIFIASLHAELGILTWSTYFGDNQENFAEEAHTIAITPNNRLIVAGIAQNVSDFPLVTSGTEEVDESGSSFIVEFETDKSIRWSTMFGGQNTSILSAAIDGQNNLYLVGSTGFSTTQIDTFEVVNETNGYTQTFRGGVTDGFITRFNSNREMVWSTFFGGQGDDINTSITTDGNGSVFVGGYSTSGQNFPLLESSYPGAYFNTYSGGLFDIYLAKFTGQGEQIWTTFYGGSDQDWYPSVKTDKYGNLFVLGSTESSNLPVLDIGDTYFQDELNNSTPNDQSDAFILTFDQQLNQHWTTYFGGYDEVGISSGGDLGWAMDIYEHMLIFAGTSNSKGPLLPVVDPGNGAYFQGAIAGQIVEDGFLCKVILDEFIATPVKEVSHRTNLIFYPNPAGDQLFIQLPFTEVGDEFHAGVYDISGKKLFSKKAEGRSSVLVLDTSGLSQGIYLLTLVSSHRIFAEKFVKN